MSEIKALIPVMTSNTEPSGVVEYSSVWTSSGNYKGYHAFDNDDSTYWASANRTSGEWLQYEFSTPQNVTGLFIDAGNEGSASDSYKLQCYDGSDWVDLTDYRAYGNGISDNIRFDNNRYAIKYRVIFGGASTHNTRTLQLYGPDGHSSYIGDIEAIRDWLNASLYNKEEIEDLFIQNNQQGLIPYDLTVQGYEPEQYVKLVGQTSGKVYNLCLGGLLGDMIKWTKAGEVTGTSLITIPQNAKGILIIGTYNTGSYTAGIDMFLPILPNLLSSTPIYFDTGGGGTAGGLYARWGITDSSVVLNTANHRGSDILSILKTMVYYY